MFGRISVSRPMISLREVYKRFPGNREPAVRNLSLDIEEGETVVLVGPSGCGKTTTLRMINRLIEPTSGTIEVDGRDVMQQDPVRLRRRLGYVIQSIGLMPDRTVAQNIGTVPELEGWDRQRIDARVRELAGMLHLDEELLERYPAELSGGQRQRVGVARALAADPPVMLMDEPFAAVDPIDRSSVIEDGELLGWVDERMLGGVERVGEVTPQRFSAYVTGEDSLRQALDSIATSRTNVAVVVTEGQRYRGILTIEKVSREIVS